MLMRQLLKEGLWKMQFNDALAKEMLRDEWRYDTACACLTWESLAREGQASVNLSNATWYGHLPRRECLLCPGFGLSFLMHNHRCMSRLQSASAQTRQRRWSGWRAMTCSVMARCCGANAQAVTCRVFRRMCTCTSHLRVRGALWFSLAGQAAGEKKG